VSTLRSGNLMEPAGGPAAVIRPARVGDIPALIEIEERCFTTDRLSRRSFQHLLTRAHALSVVAQIGERVAGYAIVLLHGNTSLARLYSLAVAPEWRGRGLAQQLLAAAEAGAAEQGCVELRLEVREDNAGAIALYQRLGYRRFGYVSDYYEDHQPALRMEKQLAGGRRLALSRVPYVPQTLDFTCGPASLLMAMRALDERIDIDRRHELQLWRESTLIFMTSGHGGCGPRGLALAAARRGFVVEVYLTDTGVPFIDSVRSQEKKDVMRVVHEDFVQQTEAAGIPVFERGLSADELAALVDNGAVPIVLISSWRIYGERFPHWVVITGQDERFIYIHDPFVDWEAHKTTTDCLNVPIARAEFGRMARYGSTRLRSAVVLKGRR